MYAITRVRLDPAGRRDDDLRLRVVDADGELVADAKPPNTTEWIAPSRAHASIATAASGNHRHVDDDAVALLDAERLQDARERRDLVTQLPVRERPDGVASPASRR